jgi:hypothetical protein
MPRVAEIRKAIVALAVPLLVGFAGRVGLDINDPDVLAAITALLTAAVVYLIPNEPGDDS